MRLSHPTEAAPLNLDTLDLLDPHLYSAGDPHQIWHGMRQHAPVRWQQVTSDGLGFWSVTRLADTDRVLRDSLSFTSQRGTLLNLLGTDDPAGGRQMAVTDPPQHTRMRVPLQRVLTATAVEHRAEEIRREVRRLLAPALDGRPFDVAAALAFLPMAVTGTLMGLDPHDWPRLTHLTTMAVAPDDPEYQLPSGSKATLQRAHRELFAYFQDTVSRRQHALGDDLLSVLLQIEVEPGQRLPPGDIVANCYSLLLGANVTTPHVPSATLLELITVGGYAGWASQPDLIGSGVEEALRWASPANHFMRHATRDVELSGVTIRAGDAVVAWLGSANRDATAFAEPYRFDVRRKPNPHVAFGVGPHYCVGHAVARVTLRILFEEFFQLFESIELAGNVEHLCSNFVAGIKHLPITARPRPGAARWMRS